MTMALDLMRCAEAYARKPWFFQTKKDPDVLVAKLDSSLKRGLFNLSLWNKLHQESPWIGRVLYWIHGWNAGSHSWDGLATAARVDALKGLASQLAKKEHAEEASDASSQQFWQWGSRGFSGAASVIPAKEEEGSFSALWNRLFPDKCSYEFGVAHMQGRRKSMEDEHIIEKMVLSSGKRKHYVDIAGIADGHGGRGAATFIKKNFSAYFQAAFEKYNREGLSDEGVTAAIQETCLKLDKAYGGKAGSTLSVALIIDGNVWTCNLGDARAVLSNGGKAVQLSADQKCDAPKYRRMVEKLGGQIIHRGIPRVNGVLAIPAAIGDHELVGREGKNCVVHMPTVRKIPRSQIAPNSHLIVACDGLWDVCSSKQAVSYVHQNARSRGLKGAAQGLIAKAYHAGSTDNISALVLNLS